MYTVWLVFRIMCYGSKTACVRLKVFVATIHPHVLGMYACNCLSIKASCVFCHTSSLALGRAMLAMVQNQISWQLLGGLALHLVRIHNEHIGYMLMTFVNIRPFFKCHKAHPMRLTFANLCYFFKTIGQNGGLCDSINHITHTHLFKYRPYWHSVQRVITTVWGSLNLSYIF